jgi:hypothetical protein
MLGAVMVAIEHFSDAIVHELSASFPERRLLGV